MAAKKRVAKKKAGPATAPGATWQSQQLILLEQIRGQNSATIDAVSASERRLLNRIDELARDHGGRLDALESAVRLNSSDIKRLDESVRQNSADIERLTETVHQNSEDIQKNSEAIERLTSVTESLADKIAALTSRVERIEAVLEMKVSGSSTSDLEARIRRIEERLGIV